MLSRSNLKRRLKVEARAQRGSTRCAALGRCDVVLPVFMTLSLLLAGCMVGPDYVRPVVEQPLHFKSQPASTEAPPVAKEWWQLYRDSDLDQLIASAQASNQTLRQAVARVDEARALARVAGSFLYPTISLDPRFIRERLSGNRDSTITGQRVLKGATINDWLIPLDLTYEIDVWGRVRRSFESAGAQAAASLDDLAVVRSEEHTSELQSQ